MKQVFVGNFRGERNRFSPFSSKHSLEMFHALIKYEKLELLHRLQQGTLLKNLYHLFFTYFWGRER